MMNRSKASTQVVALLWLMLAPTAHADSNLQCANGIVSNGHYAEQLQAACGLPMLKETLDASQLGGTYDAEWFYNFGPRQLLRIIRLRQGKVVSIEDDGYGFEGTPKLSCDFYSLREGLSKLRLMLACDKPARRETTVVYRQLQRGEPSAATQPILRERWHYNSEAGERVRTVILENGRIHNVEEKKLPAALGR